MKLAMKKSAAVSLAAVAALALFAACGIAKSPTSSLNSMADDYDWKLSFLRAKRTVIETLTRIEPMYFSPDAGAEVNAQVAQLLERYKANFVSFVTAADFTYNAQPNANNECAEIPDPGVRQIRLSTPLCRSLSESAVQREIIREIFRKLAGTSDDLSRWASFTLVDGWERYASDITPFPITGNYQLNKIEGTGSIQLAITQKDGVYSISVNSLSNWNGASLQFSSLRGAGGDWTATATNPSSYSWVYEFGGEYGDVTKTATGSESLDLHFSPPNQVSLRLRDLVQGFSYLTEGSIVPRGPWVWVDGTTNISFSGRKTN